MISHSVGMILSWKFHCDSIVPPCGHAVCRLKYGWPQGAMNPKPWQHQSPLSNAHYISLSESFYVYFMIDCFHLFWAAGSSHEEHAKWLIYDCGFLCLTSTSTQTHLTGHQFYLLVKPWIPPIQTHDLELFHSSRCNCTAPISYTEGLSLCPLWLDSLDFYI